MRTTSQVNIGLAIEKKFRLTAVAFTSVVKMLPLTLALAGRGSAATDAHSKRAAITRSLNKCGVSISILP